MTRTKKTEKQEQEKKRDTTMKEQNTKIYWEQNMTETRAKL